MMTIKGTARRAWHIAIWMMISTVPNWLRPQSGWQGGTSHFGSVETNYSTSDESVDRSID